MAKSGAASTDRARGRDEAVKAGPLRSVRGKAEPEGPMALDRLIHERMRLGILSALAVNERMSFGDLKTLLKTTDGNLSVHSRKLEEAEYVNAGRVPRTGDAGVHSNHCQGCCAVFACCPCPGSARSGSGSHRRPSEIRRRSRVG